MAARRDGAASGCEFLKVRSCGSSKIRHYFVKRTTYPTDMVRRLTDDHTCRERLVWQHGVLDRLPAETDSPMLAHACDGDGWALLMRDVSASLQKLERRTAGDWNVLSWPQVSTIVDALASIHARFYRDPVLGDPALGLCTAYQMYAWLRPTMMDREAAAAPRFITMQRTGWTLLDRLDAPDVATALGEAACGSDTSGEGASAVPIDAGSRRSETRELRTHRRPHTAPGRDRLAIRGCATADGRSRLDALGLSADDRVEGTSY